MNPKVIDLSHYDDVTDRLVGARNMGIRGVIHKCTEGSGIVDPLYQVRRQYAQEHGLLWGAYHFIRPGNIGTQVSVFLRAANVEGDTLIALDYEVAAVNVNNARAWIDMVEHRTGRDVVLYSGNTIKEALGGHADPWWGARRLWLAQYSSVPVVQRSWNRYWLWQYTGDGNGPLPHTVPGILPAGAMDISHWAGTDEQLAAQWSGLRPAPRPEPETVSAGNSGAWPAIWGPQEGKASWYADDQNADGSAVHPGDMTCAHKTADFGTLLKVTRTDTGSHVVCRVTDRGPFVAGRIVDLRPAAARALGIIDAGVVRVRIERLA